MRAVQKMKKNQNEIQKEKLFSFETAEELFPFEQRKAFSAAHSDRFKVKVKKSQKKLKSEKNKENKS